jgi:hypothetical protein
MAFFRSRKCRQCGPTEVEATTIGGTWDSTTSTSNNAALDWLLTAVEPEGKEARDDSDDSYLCRRDLL